MGSALSLAGIVWVVLIVVALTASCLIAVTVAGLRANHGAWELFGELVVVSVLVPTGLVFAATRIPPEFFEFLP